MAAPTRCDDRLSLVHASIWMRPAATLKLSAGRLMVMRLHSLACSCALMAAAECVTEKSVAAAPAAVLIAPPVARNSLA